MFSLALISKMLVSCYAVVSFQIMSDNDFSEREKYTFKINEQLNLFNKNIIAKNLYFVLHKDISRNSMLAEA